MAGPGAGALRVLACALSLAVGVLVVGGCLLSLYFEMVGFGTPADTGIRPSVVLPLLVGIAGGVLVPAAVCVWAAGGSRRSVVVVLVALGKR